MGVSHTGPVSRGPAFEPLSEGDPAVVSGHRIGARLGDGALGRVYYAHAPGGRPVALTVIGSRPAAEPGFAARFHRDAQAAGRVRSPWAVPVTGSGKEGDRFWIASTYVPSVSLRAAVAGTGPLPTAAVLRLVAGIARALRDIHHAGVVHGDLRPSQVLLTADGPRLKDYGITRPPGTAGWATTAPEAPETEPRPVPADGAGPDGAEAGAGPEPDGRTGAGGGPAPGGRVVPGDAEQPPGSPVFLAPEQAAGRSAVPATDVFALGQLAAYASIGAAPFGDGPAHTVAARVRQGEPDLSELPGELREIVTRCLIKDPALRPSPAQIVAMCGQAAPESTRPRTDPWLPPALMAAILAATPSAAPPPPSVPAPSVALPPPSLPPPGTAPVPPPAPPPHPPAPAWHPQHWPRLQQMHMHIPLPPRRTRRATGAFAAVTGLAVAVTAGVALAGGFDGGGRDASGVRPATTAGSPAVTGPAAPGGSAGGTATGPAAGTGGPGTGVTDLPPTAGAAPPAGPGSPAGVSYLGVTVPAGYSVSVEPDRLHLLLGALDGTFGYTDRADAFVSDGHRGTLSLLAPGLPGTLAACRDGSGAQVTGVPRRAVTGGTRMCVRSADGTTSLVAFRQLSPPGAPHPYATVDVTVWRGVGRGAESDQ